MELQEAYDEIHEEIGTPEPVHPDQITTIIEQIDLQIEFWQMVKTTYEAVNLLNQDDISQVPVEFDEISHDQDWINSDYLKNILLSLDNTKSVLKIALDNVCRISVNDYPPFWGDPLVQ